MKMVSHFRVSFHLINTDVSISHGDWGPQKYWGGPMKWFKFLSRSEEINELLGLKIVFFVTKTQS